MRTESGAKKDISSRINWHLLKVKALPDYKLEVIFVDGTHGFVDMSQRILTSNAGVFAQLKDIKLFNKVFIEHGAVTWPCEVDLAPDAMYKEIKQNGTWILKT